MLQVARFNPDEFEGDVCASPPPKLVVCTENERGSVCFLTDECYLGHAGAQLCSESMLPYVKVDFVMYFTAKN